MSGMNNTQFGNLLLKLMRFGAFLYLAVMLFQLSPWDVGILILACTKINIKFQESSRSAK